MAEHVALLDQLTQILATTEAADPLALRLCRSVVTILGVDGGAITVGHDGTDRVTLAITDPTAERIEDLHALLQEGPGLDALRHGRPIAASIEDQRGQWPMLVDALGQQREVVSLVASVPMRPDSTVLGVLTLYARDRSVASFDLEAAQFLADATAVAILGRFERSRSSQMVWSSRDRVNQATGMVVAQLAVRPADALALLRAYAFAHDLSLAQTADAIVDRRIDFRDRRTDRGQDS